MGHYRAMSRPPAEALADPLATARAMRASGRAAEAAALLAPLAAERPADVALHEQLGRSRFESGDFVGAVQSFETVVALRPTAAGDWISLAAARVRTGSLVEALAACDRALALEPRNPRAHLQRAVVGSWSFDPAELVIAERAASAALGLDPALAAAHDARCIVLRKLGRTDEAIAAGRAALAMAPATPGFGVGLAAALMDVHRDAEAAALLAPLAAATPHHVAVQRELGVALTRVGDAQAAAAALDRALALDGGDQRAVAHRIVCHQLLGESAAARGLIGVGRLVREQQVEEVPGWASVPEFDHALAADIRAHPSLRFEPVGLAARGGSLAQDLLSARTPAIDALEALLRQRIAAYQDALSPDPGHPFLREIPRDYRLSVWATLLEGGGEIASHIHEQSWLSGAYYVTVPRTVAATGADRAGWFEHGDPGVAIPGHAPELGAIQPREGLLLLFPSYLYHRTVPFEAAGESRISVSFDLTPASSPAHRSGAYR